MVQQIDDPQVVERIARLKSGEKMTPEQIAEHTAAMVGYHYTVDDYYEVGREEIRKHARAVQSDHPVHWSESRAAELGHDSLVAAPTYMSVLGIMAQRRLFDEVVTGYDVWQVMQSDQRLIFHQPIKVGDRLICDVSLESFRQAVGTDMMVTKNFVWNQHDEPVLTTFTSLVARPSLEVDPAVLDKLDHVMMKVDREPQSEQTVFGPFDRYNDADPSVAPKPYGAIDFDTLEVGQELPTVTKTLTLGNLVNYAGVAGDPNPIHFSPEVAAAVGLDGMVAHGMQTMGLAASAVGDFIGDPTAIHEYNVRFTSPVYVPAVGCAEVVFGGKVRSLDPETRRGVIAIVAKQGDRKIFGRATAHVQFA